MIFKNSSLKDSYKEISLESSMFKAESYISSKNMILTKSGFKTRPGSNIVGSGPIFNPDDYSGFSTFHMTSSYFEINESQAQIAVVCDTDEKSIVSYHIIAVINENEQIPLGAVNFYRTDYRRFSAPISWTVYSGKRTVGGGLYFLARVSNGIDNDDIVIFEINNELNSWIRLSAEDYYTPTLFINGHGDSYNIAVNNDSLRLSEVKSIEAKTLLSGNFYCYYTTDSHSASFALPECSASPSAIHIRFENEGGQVFNWALFKSYNYTDAVAFGSDSVTATYSPVSGRVYFISSDNIPYALQYIGSENNLKIFVSENYNPKTLKCLKLTSSCTIGGSGKNSSAETTVFSSESNSTGLCWINPENPLYFPENCTLAITNDSPYQSALISLNNRVYFFRGSSVLYADVIAGEKYNIADMVKGISGSNSVSLPSVTVKKRVLLPEKPITDSIALGGEEFWFCSSEGRIFSLTSALSVSSYDAFVSKEISGAAVSNGLYMVFLSNECDVFDINHKEKLLIYEWEFPFRPLSTSKIGGKDVLFAMDSVGAVYPFILTGEEDNYYSNFEGVRRKVSKKIGSQLFLSAHKNMTHCRLFSVIVDAAVSEGALLEVFDGTVKIGHHRIINGKNVLKRPSFYIELRFKFSFNGSSEIDSVGTRYRELKKI